MALYGGIDLRSTNNVAVILDEKDKVVGRSIKGQDDFPCILKSS